MSHIAPKTSSYHIPTLLKKHSITSVNVMRCAEACNFTEINSFHVSLNCTNDTKSRNASQIYILITDSLQLLEERLEKKAQELKLLLINILHLRCWFLLDTSKGAV